MKIGRTLTAVGRNIRRTPYQALAACMVMFITFLVVSIFILLALGSQQIISFYEQKPQAIAFFKDNTSDSDIEIIKNALKSSGKITSLKYVSKNEALEIYKDKNKNNPLLLELVTANILPSSLEISTIAPDDLKPIVDILKREPVIEEVVYPEDVVQTLSNAARLIRLAGAGAVSFLLVFSLLSIIMIVGFKIRVQRSEIETMKLLGASKWFIRSPFILEGAFYGLVGVLLAWTTSYVLLWYLTPFLSGIIGELKLLPVSLDVMLGILLIELVLATIVGAFGSYSAVRRYLKL